MMESERGFLFAELFDSRPHAHRRRARFQPENWRPFSRIRRVEAIHDR